MSPLMISQYQDKTRQDDRYSVAATVERRYRSTVTPKANTIDCDSEHWFSLPHDVFNTKAICIA